MDLSMLKEIQEMITISEGYFEFGRIICLGKQKKN
jgi:hypothetical protein